MSKFDWCYNKVCNKRCLSYDRDHCDGCNYFEAYLLGAVEFSSAAKVTIDANNHFICDRCKESIGKTTKKIETVSDFIKNTKYCIKCGARLEE